MVWHTQTAKKPKPIVMVRSKATLPGSLATLLDQVTMLGIGGVSETTGRSKYLYIIFSFKYMSRKLIFCLIYFRRTQLYDKKW